MWVNVGQVFARPRPDVGSKVAPCCATLGVAIDLDVMAAVSSWPAFCCHCDCLRPVMIGTLIRNTKPILSAGSARWSRDALQVAVVITLSDALRKTQFHEPDCNHRVFSVMSDIEPPAMVVWFAMGAFAICAAGNCLFDRFRRCRKRACQMIGAAAPAEIPAQRHWWWQRLRRQRRKPSPTPAPTSSAAYGLSMAGLSGHLRHFGELPASPLNEATPPNSVTLIMVNVSSPRSPLAGCTGSAAGARCGPLRMMNPGQWTYSGNDVLPGAGGLHD